MLRKLFRRRTWEVPEPEPEGRTEARRAVLDAAQRMSEIIAQQPHVDALHGSLERVNRENRLAPRIFAALGAHGE